MQNGKDFFREKIANPNDGIIEKTKIIQGDCCRINFIRDDKSPINVTLIDKDNISKNILEVINQYTNDDGKNKNRYDVTILVNGFPLIHVELKRRGNKDLYEAFNQIKRYQTESFWASSGLFEYIQIFVISNGTNTKYYSNTVRLNHVNKSNNGVVRTSRQSFEFTSFWTNDQNEHINDLVDFTKTFFSKYTILSILTKYCVFTTEDQLLVMRPYQIAATEKNFKSYRNC